LLPAEAAAHRPTGENVLLLIRPESIELQRLEDGAPETGIKGKVRSHTFLGPVTRLNVETPIGEIIVDVGSSRALTLSEGTGVALAWDPATPRLIAVSAGDGDTSPTHPSSLRSRDDASEPRATASGGPLE
jgi:putative spermidine/putrescine transport system ATP-binding protein